MLWWWQQLHVQVGLAGGDVAVMSETGAGWCGRSGCVDGLALICIGSWGGCPGRRWSANSWSRDEAEAVRAIS